MDRFLQYTAIGIPFAAVYAISATGLVVTYTISGIFNFAHGAFSMLAALTFWQLHVEWGISTWPALLLVVVVIAPVFGAIVEWGLIRGLEGASEVVRVVVTTSLMLGLLGLAQLVWPSGVNRNLTGFYGASTVDIFGTAVTVHRLIIVGVALLVAVALWVLLNRTRVGVTMRAVVDDRSLLQLNGGRPALVSMFSWALGAALAAIAGILIAPIQNLEPITLTLLIVTAFSAAAVGRLRSLPLTFLGALIVGLGEAYLKLIPDSAIIGSFQLSKLATAFSPIVLLAAIVFLPQPKLRVSGQHARREHWKVPSMKSAAIGGAALVVTALGITLLLQPVDRLLVVDGLFFALVALSLVPLTGYAGQISLAQVTFAGVGGIVAAMVGADLQPLSLVIAVAVTAIFGALVALPALRLQGIYLALATAALSILMYQLVFLQPSVMPGNNRQVPPLAIGHWWTVSSTLSQVVVLAVAFGLVGLGLVALRRGSWGRRLTAMKDSPVACATLGLHLTRTKVATFALSAGIAGLAGAVAGRTFTTDQLRFEANLPVTTFAVVGGVGVVSGALIGGVLLGVLPVLNTVFAANSIGWFRSAEVQVTKLNNVLPGLIGVSLGRNPTGASPQVGDGFEPVTRRPPVAIGAVVVEVLVWVLAYRQVVDGWAFLAASLTLVAALPGVAECVDGGVDAIRRVAVALVAVAGVVAALVVPWPDLADSNGVRFVALFALAVVVGVVGGGLAGVLSLGADDVASPDLLGVTAPLDRSDILEADRALGISEEDLVGAP
jgi:branched-chain amino acid transport system permease protein